MRRLALLLLALVLADTAARTPYDPEMCTVYGGRLSVRAVGDASEWVCEYNCTRLGCAFDRDLDARVQ